MNENIMTWHQPSNNGAFQKNTEYGIFSDLLTVKPTFSFEYTSFNYIEQTNQFNIDGVDMTSEQKTEVLMAINNFVIPNNFIVHNKIRKALDYLSQTDWYITRFIETQKPIPNEISLKRENAREYISNVKLDSTIKVKEF